MSFAAAAAPVQECDLIFFEVGGQVFGADPLEVLRVDRRSATMPFAEVLPSAGARVLVARGLLGEFQFGVDRVLGVRRVPKSLLRRAPALANVIGGARVREVMGVLLEGESPVLLLDLFNLSARASRAVPQGT